MSDNHTTNNYADIEEFAKNFWEKKKINIAKIDHLKEPEVILDFFPYPSGVGLHIGHTLGYFATDIYARFRRLNGKNVLFSMSYDSFGLPAEQFAIETGQHPEITTKQNISNMQKQLDNLGLMHDPTRIFSTTEPSYYKWTQWIFIKLYNSYFNQEQNKAMPIKHLEEKLRNGGLNDEQIYDALSKARLAYLDSMEVNWCPKLGTVLSDEEIINGVSERGGYPVCKKLLKQWVLRITKYSTRLLEHLDNLNWPESVKEMQRNWIGVSHGHEITLQEYRQEEYINRRQTQPYIKIEIEPILVNQIPTTAIPIKESASAENSNIEIFDTTNSTAEKRCEKLSLKLFTTRIETISGATFCAISIKHPEIAKFLYTPESREFFAHNISKEEYVGSVFTGVYMLNLISNKKIPIFIADYVLSYGTFAVMGVPAHDERDYKLAKQHELEIIPVIKFDKEFIAEHNLTNNDIENGKIPCAYTRKDQSLYLYNGKTITQEIADLEKNDWVKRKTQTKLRDWIFSRQRYWGEPFPVILDNIGNAYMLEASVLPLELPELKNFQAAIGGQEIAKPLDRLPEWRNVNFVKLDLHTARVVNGEPGQKINIDSKEYIIESGLRETNTMPNWAGSCWYYLRYMDPGNDNEFVSMAAQQYWSGKNWSSKRLSGKDWQETNIENKEISNESRKELNKETRNLGCVDLYLGGAEHAVLHLLYARFWHMVLYDLGYVLNPEPFNRLFNQGMVLGPTYIDSLGKYYSLNEVHRTGAKWFTKDNQEVFENIGKIGKRYKNGVPPEEITAKFGIDSLRLYMMYLGPLEQNKPWEYGAIKGMTRFLEKILKLEITKASEADEDKAGDNKVNDGMLYDFDQMLKKVTSDCQALKFNTAIAAIIIFVNKYQRLPEDLYEKLLIIIAPFAPHLAEYLFAKHEFAVEASIFEQNWPKAMNIEKHLTKLNIVFTINGKKRAVEEFAHDVSDFDLEEYAKKLESNTKETNIKEPDSKNTIRQKIIIIRDKNGLPKLVNIVTC